jgi:hypothetical protein
MDRVTAFLDAYPNADVEISAAVQDPGRAPILVRRYQDHILFGRMAILGAVSTSSGYRTALFAITLKY